MLDLLTSDQLRQLAMPGPGHRVTITMPTHPAGLDRAQDTIRLKNLLTEATRELLALGSDRTVADRLLAPARALGADDEFWTGLDRGLVVLVDADGMQTFRLAEPVDEFVMVADSFRFAPLLSAVAVGNEFWVLALSRNDVRLLHGNRVQLDDVDLGDTPRSLEEALRLDDREAQLQSHAAGRVGGGRTTAAFHGQGSTDDAAHEETERFCRIVDHHVRQLVGPSTAPTVLAGERRLLDTYRAISRLENLVPDVVAGSADHRSARDLADAGWPLVRPVFDREADRDAERFGSGTVPVADRLDEVLVAALDGRVESLTIPLDCLRWGRLDPIERVVIDHDQRQPGDVELFDHAAAQTIRHGGRVRAVPLADVPGGGPVAAVLRY